MVRGPHGHQDRDGLGCTATLLRSTPLWSGSRVEVVFDPFAMDSVEVRFQGRSMGQGLPVTIGRHSHPQARKEAAPTPAPTGIDYLGLLAERREAELAASINYAQLSFPGGVGAGHHHRHNQLHRSHQRKRGDLAMTIDRLRAHWGLAAYAVRQRPSPVHAALSPVPRRRGRGPGHLVHR